MGKRDRKPKIDFCLLLLLLPPSLEHPLGSPTRLTLLRENGERVEAKIRGKIGCDNW